MDELNPFLSLSLSPSVSLSGPDGFALGECVSETHADSVLFCLASNFLEVKQLASVLIRSLPHKVVRLEVNTHTHSHSQHTHLHMCKHAQRHTHTWVQHCSTLNNILVVFRRVCVCVCVWDRERENVWMRVYD